MSATLLLTSMVYSYRLWRCHSQNTAMLSDQIQTQIGFFVLFAIFQLATGFTMISLKHEPIGDLWISGSIVGFIIVIGSWFAFLYCIISSAERPRGRFFQTVQIGMLTLCTLTVLSMIFLMANKIT